MLYLLGEKELYYIFDGQRLAKLQVGRLQRTGVVLVFLLLIEMVMSS